VSFAGFGWKWITAAEQLRVLKPGAGVRLPTGQTRLVFRRPVAPRLQAADYVHRLTSHILVSITPARWALPGDRLAGC